MGGSNSGRYPVGTVGDNGKDLCERMRRMEMPFMRKQGHLTPGRAWVLAWHCGSRSSGNITGRTSADGKSLLLIYNIRQNGGEWETVKQPVQLETTPCHYGGVRTWFLCLTCKWRVGILYGAGKYFLCRHCSNLCYRSQRENEADHTLTQAQNMRERLGGNGNMFDFYPNKPKGMHWKTYSRLRCKGRELDLRSWAAIAARYP